MARPRKEGMDYFPHDTDATGDEKIDAMRALFGNDGYAFYFILCERIYRTSNAELDVSKPVLLTPIIKKLLVTPERFEEMLDAAFELKLLSRTDFEKRGVITSHGIKQRFGEVSEMRKRWRKSKENTIQNDVFHEENRVENISENAEETRESKAKQSKEKKSNNDAVIGDDFLKLSEAFCNLHEKGEWQLKENERSDMKELLSKGIPLDFIIRTMQMVYESKLKQGEKIKSFSYYKKLTEDHWDETRGFGKPKDDRRRGYKQKPYIPIVRPTKDEDPMTDEEIEEIKKMAEKLKEEPA